MARFLPLLLLLLLPLTAHAAECVVEAYGARGDGVTDCTAAVTAAITDCAGQGENFGESGLLCPENLAKFFITFWKEKVAEKKKVHTVVEALLLQFNPSPLSFTICSVLLFEVRFWVDSSQSSHRTSSLLAIYLFSTVWMRVIGSAVFQYLHTTLSLLLSSRRCGALRQRHVLLFHHRQRQQHGDQR